eukprot:1922102-Pleurochrysis_carterae.AAC.2
MADCEAACTRARAQRTRTRHTSQWSLHPPPYLSAPYNISRHLHLECLICLCTPFRSVLCLSLFCRVSLPRACRLASQPVCFALERAGGRVLALVHGGGRRVAPDV